MSRLDVAVARYEARKRADQVKRSVRGSLAGWYDKPVKRSKR
jgi:hypothetical protein